MATRKGPYKTGPYKFVCTKCWSNPFLHLPDKHVADDGYSYPTEQPRALDQQVSTWHFDFDQKKLNILLVEPDYYTRFPPLGLLKLSAFHKVRGDSVKLVRYPELTNDKFDVIYVTSLFTYAFKKVHEAIRFYKKAYPNTPVVLGGIYASLLPDHAAFSGATHIFTGVASNLEDIIPDYSLVKRWNWDANIIFSSRGCMRGCGFCAVPILEGKLRVRNNIRDLIDNNLKKIILWDNNILGSKNAKEILNELATLEMEIDFNQGLDARLIDEDMARSIGRLKTKRIRLAYDDDRNYSAIKNAVTYLSGAGISRRNIVVYTLFNYRDSPKDFLKRVKDLLSLGVVSYPMRYEPLCVLKKNEFVSPLWEKNSINMVQIARRVIGYGGAFPPYKPLVNKLNNARSFETAFLLRPSFDEIKRELNTNEIDTQAVYLYYKTNNLTVKDLPLKQALERVKSVNTMLAMPMVSKTVKRNKRLGGSSDWR